MDLTNDFGAMVIVNRGARRNFLDKIFWYKADKVKIKNIGCKQFNDYHDDNYNSKWKDKNLEFDFGRYMDNKKKSDTIKVEKISR